MMRSATSLLLWRLCATLIIAGLASGCGGETTGTAGEPGSSTPAAGMASGAPPSGERPTVLLVESWRIEDLQVWNREIIPVFEASHPHIDVRFVPTRAPEYDLAVRARLEQDLAGDIIACRPFDASLALFEAGHLVDLTGDATLDSFEPDVLAAWSTDKGSETFCVPVASVLHGFLYNTEIFDELGLTPPATSSEFQSVLEAVRSDGRYVPLAVGAAEKWELATVGFQTIGPTHWRGETGRQALIDGSAKFTDAEYVRVFEALAEWQPFLPDGVEDVTLEDARLLFSTGNAAVYPGGSWEVSWFEQYQDLAYGVFAPPVPSAGMPCYVTDHTDMAMGLNRASSNEAEARQFLAWLGSAEFAQVYSNALPGFFSLQTQPVQLDNPIATEIAAWRERCGSTIRNSAQFLSRGEPNLELELWETSAAVATGGMEPAAAAQRLQDGLDEWFVPVTD